MHEDVIPQDLLEALERSEKMLRPFRHRADYLERRLEVAERLAAFAASMHSDCANEKCPVNLDIEEWNRIKEENA